MKKKTKTFDYFFATKLLQQLAQPVAIKSSGAAQKKVLCFFLSRKKILA